MKNLKTALPLLMVASACAVTTDRGGYSEAWYYERLTPYYENTLSMKPRMQLRAVRELVGVEIVLTDGSAGHADVFRQDIELFFAAPVMDQTEQKMLGQAAIRATCPQTDLRGIEDRIAYSNPTYVVFQNVPCLGHAS